MVEEYKNVVGNSEITYEMTSKLVYTEQVLFEGQRYIKIISSYSLYYKAKSWIASNT